ncbi:hypothetical protein CYY_008288 [Polysphondylium violaceum]|uniref:RWP-RK domain-containing protein n=1 Tax=Polysphondylium violaceum TaxID=133409 RepID=A0A8J4PNB4_9MYCE|nr:hypothetical protein CYY_008288 [Polysphondylium violaceum]
MHFTTQDINLEYLSKYFHLPINSVAKEIGICATVLKKICRKNGIPRWPHRKIKSIDKMILNLENTVPKSKEEELKINYEIQALLKKKNYLIKNPNILALKNSPATVSPFANMSPPTLVPMEKAETSRGLNSLTLAAASMDFPSYSCVSPPSSPLQEIPSNSPMMANQSPPLSPLSSPNSSPLHYNNVDKSPVPTQSLTISELSDLLNQKYLHNNNNNTNSIKQQKPQQQLSPSQQQQLSFNLNNNKVVSNSEYEIVLPKLNNPENYLSEVPLTTMEPRVFALNKSQNEVDWFQQTPYAMSSNNIIKVRANQYHFNPSVFSNINNSCSPSPSSSPRMHPYYKEKQLGSPSKSNGSISSSLSHILLENDQVPIQNQSSLNLFDL